MRHVVRPLTEATRARLAGSPAPKWSVFKAGWPDTLELLNREVKTLGADTFVLQLDVTENQVRIDGGIRADARPACEAAAVAVESKRGPLLFACDRFTDWKDNVRAIALGLEALRKVDRYGITQSDEQYTGFRALPPVAIALTSGSMTAEESAQFLIDNAGAIGREMNATSVMRFPEIQRTLYLAAAHNLHPDKGGSAEAFLRLSEAVQVLDAARA